MKLFYDALFRTIIATIFSELVSLPFLKLANPSLSAKIYDILIFAVPVFIAMLGYNIVKAHFYNRASEKSK